MIEVKAPNPLPPVALYESPSIFLAGSIDMGNAIDWQSELTSRLKDWKCTILNPRRDDWDSSWVQDISNSQFRQQVNWELDSMDYADIIVYVFDPKGQAPITLMELGLHAHDGRKPKFVVCPEGYWRRGNVQVVCDVYHIPLFETIDEMLPSLLKELL